MLAHRRGLWRAVQIRLVCCVVGACRVAHVRLIVFVTAVASQQNSEKPKPFPSSWRRWHLRQTRPWCLRWWYPTQGPINRFVRALRVSGRQRRMFRRFFCAENWNVVFFFACVRRKSSITAINVCGSISRYFRNLCWRRRQCWYGCVSDVLVSCYFHRRLRGNLCLSVRVWVFPLDPWCWGLQKANTHYFFSTIISKLFLKNSNLCDQNTWTLRTDRRADQRATCRSNRRNSLWAMSPNKNIIHRNIRIRDVYLKRLVKMILM